MKWRALRCPPKGEQARELALSVRKERQSEALVGINWRVKGHTLGA